MSSPTILPLKDARPRDQAHLLLWDAPTPHRLWELTYYNNAARVSYRENLLQRLDPNDKFLNLHHAIDEELAAIKAICQTAQHPVVLLEGLDILITYLRIKPGGQVTLFWQNLEKTRKLDSLLWILIPSPLPPQVGPRKGYCEYLPLYLPPRL